MTDEYQSPRDFGPGEQGEVRRWLLELRVAERRDEKYKKTARKIWDKYRGQQIKKNSFNILWANTETIAPAVFNSTPKPDVRRRFKDDDPLGKAVAEVTRRALEFAVDTENFDGAIKFDVLDMLLPGRGVSRVRYVPAFNPMSTMPDTSTATPTEPAEGVAPTIEEATESESYEELAWEQVCLDHVQWDRIHLGPGKTWEEVDWISFDHRMKKDEMIEKFGSALANQIELDDANDEDINKLDMDQRQVFQTALIREVWCKPEKCVYFLSDGFKQKFLKTVKDPLELMGFFPIPRPLYAVLDSSCMDPTPFYEQYKEQAEELDRISTRINKIVDAMKVRGIYDATLSELSELMKGQDNDLIPAESAARFVSDGGFEKAIWFMDIQPLAIVLKELYTQREATKQVIYEITGISDILRGATDPNETLGAQQIKAQSGSQRIQQMQREVARYIRDLMRMMGEIIGQKFQLETLQKMTGVKIPTDAEAQQQYQQELTQWQQQAMQAQQQQQPPPPQPQPAAVTWEKVVATMRDDLQRTFKIDVETDSTVAAAIQEDMAGLKDVLTAVVQFISGVGPAIQMGAFPIEAAKEIIMTICRRSKMGNAVEDALDKIKAPEPAPDTSMQQAQMKAQSDQQAAQIKAQTDAQSNAQKIQAQQEADKARISADMMVEKYRIDMETRMQTQHAQMQSALDNQQAQNDAKLEIILAHLKAQTAIEVAEIGAKATLSAQQKQAAETVQ